jgi:hypothetical protein
MVFSQMLSHVLYVFIDFSSMMRCLAARCISFYDLMTNFSANYSVWVLSFRFNHSRD